MTSEEIKLEIESLRTVAQKALDSRVPATARQYLSEVPLWEIAFQLAISNEKDKPDLCPDCGHPKGRCMR